MTIASAPGKLFIAGEYAVLEGGAALLTAVGARAIARVRRSTGEHCDFTHPLSGEELRFDFDRKGGLQWSGESPGHWGDVLAAVVATWHSDEFPGSTLPALSISIDTDAFFANAGGELRKLGFGSSAAATVALSRAILSEIGSSTGETDFASFCRAAHSRLQGGRGSGADILASLNGGVIATKAGSNEVQSINWPAGLHMLAIWSGVEASSAALVGRFDAYRQERGENFSRNIGDLIDASSRVVDAWQSGDVPLILSTLRDCDAALLRLDSDAGVGIYTEVHGRLRVIAETEGVVYKVSGAGGGDFGLAFSSSADIALRARNAFEASGFSVYGGGLAEPGVRVDSA